jgi:hypothetical protein
MPPLLKIYSYYKRVNIVSNQKTVEGLECLECQKQFQLLGRNAYSHIKTCNRVSDQRYKEIIDNLMTKKEFEELGTYFDAWSFWKTGKFRCKYR